MYFVYLRETAGAQQALILNVADEEAALARLLADTGARCEVLLATENWSTAHVLMGRATHEISLGDAENPGIFPCNHCGHATWYVDLFGDYQHVNPETPDCFLTRRHEL